MSCHEAPFSQLYSSVQLTLPARVEPLGKLVLEQGARAGRCYRCEAAACRNPVCRCEHITLHCLADGPGIGQPDAGNQPVLASLELDLAKHHIHDVKVPETSAEVATLGKSVAEEIQERDWDSLRRLYAELKQERTEHTDLDSTEAEFPEEAVEGLTVGYYEILPYAPSVEFPFQSEQWLMDDSYCVKPKCGCHYAALAFWPLRCNTDQAVTGEPSVLFRYDYRTGSMEDLPDTKDRGAKAPVILEAFKRTQPDLNSFLAVRHATLHRLFQGAISRKRHPTQTPRPARNAPCPCGSGKKYKRCCGAVTRQS